MVQPTGGRFAPSFADVTLALTPPAFSIALIARNEAPQLPRLVEGLKEFLARGGDLRLVDTGSEDGTARVARSLGFVVEEVSARFHRRLTADEAAAIEARFAVGDDGPLVSAGERIFDFGAAREHASLQARRDWVLQLDASDEILAFDFDFLDEAVRRSGAAQIEYRQMYGPSSHHVARFYDRRLVEWRGRVHELPYRRPGAPPLPALRCRDDQFLIRHHKGETKERVYLSGLALDALAFPENPRWRHYLGRELYYHRWFRSALPVLHEHAARADAGRSERSESLCLAAMCAEALDDPEAAANSYRRAADVDPTRRQPLVRLAALEGRLGRFVESAAAARTALSIERSNAFIEPDANYGTLPHALLYWALFWLGRISEAREHWEICRRLEPDEPVFAQHARLFLARD